MVQNKYSKKGYRDVLLNISGKDGTVSGSVINLTVPCQELFVNAICDGNAVYGELYFQIIIYEPESHLFYLLLVIYFRVIIIITIIN